MQEISRTFSTWEKVNLLMEAGRQSQKNSIVHCNKIQRCIQSLEKWTIMFVMENHVIIWNSQSEICSNLFDDEIPM